MDDLISRAAAITELMQMVKVHEHETFRGELLHYTGIKAMLEAQPDVDTTPHGRWEERRVDCLEESTIGAWQSAKCTNCGKYHTTPYLYCFSDYDFCPHCGAKMDGERRDD